MQKVFLSISPKGLSDGTLVPHVPTSRFERQHNQKMQAEPTIVSMGSHGRRIPFRCHPNRAARN